MAAFDVCTGALREPVRHFDTYFTRSSGSALNEMNIFLDSLPNGTLVMIAVADEAGLNNFPPNGCSHLGNPYIEPFFQKIESLGGQQVRNYCYWDSYALVAVKGEGAARAEQLGSAVEASAQTTATASTSINPINPTGKTFSKDGGTGNVNVTAAGGCGWASQTDASWITINSGGAGVGSGTLNYSVGVNPNSGFRTGTITVAGQQFSVVQSATISALRIDSLNARAGRTSGGQQIILTGAFPGLSTVTMGGVSASWFYTNGAGDTSAVTVTTPAHSLGAIQIDLSPVSGADYSKPNAFAYLPTVFTDDALMVGVTIVKAQHVIELRQAVDAMRAVGGLSGAPWTDAALAPTSTTIKAVHIQELRTYLDDAATRLGYSTQPYTDPALTISFMVRKVHIEELRQRVRSIAG